MSTILCFNWNTDKVALCEKYYKDEKGNISKDKIEKSSLKLIRGNSCYNPLFFDIIKDKIALHSPEIVVISTENDLSRGTYFHSNFLPENMSTINYKLLVRDKYDGLRTSIYVKTTDTSTKSVKLSKSLLFTNNTYDCPKGGDGDGDTPLALVLYINTPSGNFVFINIQISNGYSNTDICLNNIEDKFIKNKDINYVFLMGDFSNQYILDKNDDSEVKAKQIRDTTLPTHYSESDYVNVPTYGQDYIPLHPTATEIYNQVLLNRKNTPDYKDSYNFGYDNRIFHRTYNNIAAPLTCIDYETIYGSPMLDNKTYHLGVLGVYEIK